MAADLEDRRPAAMTTDSLGHHHRIASPSGDDADSLPAEIERVVTGRRPWQWLSVMHGREGVA